MNKAVDKISETKKRVWSALAAVLLLSLVGGCGTQSNTPTQNVKDVPFKIGEFPQENITWVAIAANGYSNLSMTTFDLDSGATAVSLMGSGQLAGAADVSEPPINLAFDKGIKIKIVWVTSFSPTFMILKPGVTDLRGKTVSAPGGSITEYWMEQYLHDHGLSMSDVKYVDLSGQNAVSAYKAGALDAVEADPPFSDAITKLGGMTVATHRETNWDIFSQQFIDSNPAVVQAFVCDTEKAQAAFIADPSKGYQALSQKLGISVSDLQTAMPPSVVAPPSSMFSTDYMGTTTAPPQLATSVSGIGAWMLQHGRVTHSPTVAEVNQLVDRSFAQKAINGNCP